jgi:hypothetical protein
MQYMYHFLRKRPGMSLTRTTQCIDGMPIIAIGKRKIPLLHYCNRGIDE